MLNQHGTIYIRWSPHEQRLMFILMAVFLIATTTSLLNNKISAQGLNVTPASLKSILTNQQQQHQVNNRQQISSLTTKTNSFTLHTHQRKNSESSSSFFADIEDLNDSSIKSRVGQLAPEPREQPALNFDSLIERLTRPIAELSRLKHIVREKQQPKPSNQLQTPFITIPADANNKTTMRFFRNNKTFASIVYTDEHKQQQQQQQLQQLPIQQFNGIRKARRLINCHLLDMERHAPDVALFEAKYEIETVDIEFKDMMSIIEACTDIARFKPLKAAAGGSSSTMSPNGIGGTAQHQQPKPQQQQQQQPSSSQATKPFVVVGRPVPAIPSAATTATTMTSPSNSVSTFQNVMSESINKELNSLSSAKSGMMTTELGTGNLRVRRKLAAFANGIANNNNPQQRSMSQVSVVSKRKANNNNAGNLLSTALARVGETGKKLVLGEITPPPSAIDGRSGGIKEALQEITQYDTTDLMAIWRGILPGTNWCGMGDRATSYNDLGFESDIDICCRAHDFCPIRLSAFSAGYGLFNWSFYTRSHCRCDQNFLDCLQRAESPLSQVVLKFYFNIMKTTCLHDNETSQTSHQHFWTSGGGSGNGSSLSLSLNTNSNSMMSKHQHQQQLSQKPPIQQRQPMNSQRQQATQLLVPSNDQQRLLLEQIRASLPIPALKHSSNIGSATEQRRQQQ